MFYFHVAIREALLWELSHRDNCVQCVGELNHCINSRSFDPFWLTKSGSTYISFLPLHDLVPCRPWYLQGTYPNNSFLLSWHPWIICWSLALHAKDFCSSCWFKPRFLWVKINVSLDFSWKYQGNKVKKHFRKMRMLVAVQTEPSRLNYTFL